MLKRQPSNRAAKAALANLIHACSEPCISGRPARRSPAPIFFLFALHRRSRRVLHLEPITRAPRAVERVLPFGHDAFESHLARMGEDGRAVALDMLVESDAGAGLGHNRRERSLADLKRITPQVVPFNSIRSKA